jgi:protein phosphatase 1 regulatory subunit 7
MEGLNTLAHLEVLDVGDNKIRKIENIDQLVGLREFHAAKNKITVLEGLSTCVSLYIIAVQCNFIQKI